MIDYFQYAMISYGYLTLMGLPASLYFITDLHKYDYTPSPTQSIGVLVMAPIFGVVIAGFIATLAYKAGPISPILYAVVSLTGMLLATCLVAPQQITNLGRRTLASGLTLSTVAGAVAFVTNSADLQGIPFDDYFPLTNDDTFAYLGHIDQLRIGGAHQPTINYPAGFKPLIEHAFGGRDAVVALLASIGDMLRIPTHAAFFISQRLALMLLASGIFGIQLFLTSDVRYAIASYVIAISGSFFLHQILQQFSSSSFGTVVFLALIFSATLDYIKRTQQRPGLSFITGFIAGVLLIVSPETAIIVYFILALWFIPLHHRSGLISIKLSIRNFSVGVIAGSFPALPGVLVFSAAQLRNGVGDHPGNWVANSAILQSATGLGVPKATELANVPTTLAIASVSLALLYIFSIIFILVIAINSKEQSKRLLPISFIAIVGLFISVALYFFGKGYAMLKTIDYFSILPPIMLGLSASKLCIFSRSLLRKSIICLSVLCLIIFLKLSHQEKAAIFREYNKQVLGFPLVSGLVLPTSITSETLVPDLRADALNLFLYANRLNSVQFAFKQVESHRYSTQNEPAIGMRFARVSARGLPGYQNKYFADITHTTPWPHGAYLINYNHTVRIEPSGWLPPEGTTSDNIFRWLGGEGEFTLFTEDLEERRQLKMAVSPGPDLRPDNVIELRINGQLKRSFSPADLPVQFSVDLNNLPLGVSHGTLVVQGPSAGTRQIGVSRLNIGS